MRSDSWWGPEGSVGLERRLFQAEGPVCLKVGKMFSEELRGVQCGWTSDVKKPWMRFKEENDTAGFVVFIKQVQTGGIEQGSNQRAWFGNCWSNPGEYQGGLIRRGGRTDFGHLDWGGEGEILVPYPKGGWGEAMGVETPTSLWCPTH